MGHLDPFFQELNGIGILALIVTVIAVIVRVMFCKTMKERVLTAVAGLVFAVIASLGADYALRPFAGVGSSATGGSAFMELLHRFHRDRGGRNPLVGNHLPTRGRKPHPPNNQLTLDPNTELKGFAARYAGGRHEQRGLLLWLVHDRPRQRRLPRPVV